jgi:hypothetical protein
MNKIINILVLIFSIIVLASCSSQNTQSLDGEYYWIIESNNERVFTNSGNKGTIDSGEADNFMMNQKNETMELMGSQIITLTENYTFKDVVFIVDIRGIKHDYYLLRSEAYYNALKNMDINNIIHTYFTE